MDQKVADALVLMAGAIQNLADAQQTLITDTNAIKTTLRDQTKTLARNVRDQKARAAEIAETSRKMAQEARDRVTASIR